MTSSREPPPPSTRVSRTGLYLPPALLLAGALAWCGFWFYAANLTEQRLAELKASEAAVGRKWDCADQKIAGFPFRIELHCASLRLDAILDERPARFQTGAFHAATQIYAPTLVLADVDGPLRIESDRLNASSSWDNLRVSVRFSNKLERLSAVAGNLQVEGSTASGEKFTNAAKSAEGHVRYDPARPAEDRAVDLALRLTEWKSPVMNALIGTPENVSIDVAGVATQLADLPLQGWRRLLETWRTAGGNFVIENGKLTKGALQVDAKGPLSLDADRRLQGKIDISATGLGPLITRFGGGGMNQLIGSLLVRKDGTPVQWPLQLRNGRIEIGPLRTGVVLGPLY